MDTLVGEEGNLILNPVWDREPMERFKDWSDMIIFAHPHQDPNSTVLNVLQLLEAFARDLDKERIIIVQPGGDKGMDKLFSISKSVHRVKFGDVPQVEKRGLTQMFDVILKGQTRRSDVSPFWHPGWWRMLKVNYPGLREKVMLLMTDVRTWFGVPIRMASVLELFSCKKFCFIHAFISSKQVVKMENGMTEDGVELVLI